MIISNINERNLPVEVKNELLKTMKTNISNELIKSSSIYKQKNTNYYGKFLEKPLFLSEYLNLSELLNKGLTNNIEKDLINLANVTEDDKEYDSILKLILRFQYKYPNICLRLTDELLSNTNIGPANLVLISNTKANILYSQGEVENAYKITSELLDGCYSNYAIDQ